MRHAVWWLAPLLGCSFEIEPLDPITSGGADLTMQASGDMAGPPPGDMAMPPQPDQAVAGGFMPSHLPPHFSTDGTCTLSPMTSIDTDKLQIDGAMPPNGCVFATATEGLNLEVTVLAVKNFTLNKPIVVTGARPLV